MARFSQKVLSAVTTGEYKFHSNGQSVDHAVSVVWSAGTSAGAVTIEEAPEKDYAGEWSEIDTITWTEVSSCDTSHFEGSISWIRVRISTTVVGGTVDVYLEEAS